MVDIYYISSYISSYMITQTNCGPVTTANIRYIRGTSETTVRISQPYNTAISRKVVGKSARDNPKRDCGWFWVHFSSKKFERMALEAMDMCLRVLKESTTNQFDSFNRQEQCIDHIPCCLSGLSRAHFYDNLSRNSCMRVAHKPITTLRRLLNY